MFSVGIGQLVIILFIVLILFGAGRLPDVMYELGKGVKNFQKALKDDPKENEGKANDEPKDQ